MSKRLEEKFYECQDKFFNGDLDDLPGDPKARYRAALRFLVLARWFERYGKDVFIH
jgi:hypothetical protein